MTFLIGLIRIWLVRIPLALFALWFVYMFYFMNTHTYAYRLTVSIDTPQGLRTGSSVLRVYFDTRVIFGVGGSSSQQGEAIFIDLDGGKNLIALIASQYIVMNAFDKPGHRVMVETIPPPGAKVELRRDLVPTLVTFTDINDPASARVVSGMEWRNDPRSGAGGANVLRDDFLKVLGPGYGLRSATLEMVDPGIWPLNKIGITGEPITRGIEKKMPGLKNIGAWNARTRRAMSPADPYGGGSGALIRDF